RPREHAALGGGLPGLRESRTRPLREEVLEVRLLREARVIPEDPARDEVLPDEVARALDLERVGTLDELVELRLLSPVGRVVPGRVARASPDDRSASSVGPSRTGSATDTRVADGRRPQPLTRHASRQSAPRRGRRGANRDEEARRAGTAADVSVPGHHDALLP